MALRADDVDLGRDRDLVLCAQSGDDDAFEDLYRRYFARLYRFCLRRVGDPHEAEELTQEAFTRAYGALPRLAGERRFYPWLSVIASRLCVDAFRRRARSEPTAVVDLGVLEGGHEDVDNGADVDLLGRALDRLTPRHRHVLTLREQEGWSYQHIADHYEVSLGTVEALLHRARKALRREFEVLAGGDARRAAGLPVLGWLARRLDQARNRFGGWETAWTPALGQAMAATVVAVGTVVGGVGAAGHAPVVLPTSPIAEVRAAPSGEPAPAVEPAPARSSAPASGAAAAADGTAPPATSGGTVLVTGTSVEKGPEMKQRAEDGPSTVEAEDDGEMGTDPRTLARQVVESVDHYVDEFQEDE